MNFQVFETIWQNGSWYQIHLLLPTGKTYQSWLGYTQKKKILFKSTWGNWDKFLKGLICMDHTGQYQASSTWKQQIVAAGSSLLSGCWGTRSSQFRWCRDDSRWCSTFGLMSCHSSAEPLGSLCVCAPTNANGRWLVTEVTISQWDVIY